MSEKEAGSVVTSANAEEFYANKLGLAEQAPIEAEVETPKEEVATTEPTDEAEVQSESETTEKETETKATEEKKQNPKLEKRFSELTKQREEARKEAAREREARESLESRIKELEGRAEPKPVEENVKPSPSQFNDAFEYAEALAEWSAEQAILNREKQEAERKEQENRQKLAESWKKREANVKAELSDYDEMIASAADVTVSDVVRDAIIESDVGPRILYHLAENPELVEQLNSVSPISALRQIGKLEAKFEVSETPKETKTEAETKPSIARSKAPAPISPIKTSSAVADVGVGSDGEFHGTYQQWREARKAGKVR
jgi:hypothetical protein